LQDGFASATDEVSGAQVRNALSPQSTGFLGPFLVGFLTLLASLVNFLTYQRYPLLSPEVGILFASLAVLTAAMAVFYMGLRGWLQSIFDGLLVAFLIDLNADVPWLAVAGGVGAFAVGFLAPGRLRPPLTVFGGVVLVTTVLGFGESKPWISIETSTPSATTNSPPMQVNPRLPAIIHLVLDEHLGIEGFPDDPAGQVAANQLREFYLSNDFTVYGHAYSQHLHTINALPDILNFGRDTNFVGDRSGIKLERTKYFTELERSGYQLRIYESDYANFCGEQQPPYCLTYLSNNLQPLLSEPFSLTDKLIFITTKFIGLSDGAEEIDLVYRRRVASLLRRSGLPMPDTLLEQRGSFSIASVPVFEKLIADLSSAKPGTAYFAHILLPHFPYATTRDCETKPRNQWFRRKSLEVAEMRRAAYYEQVRCVTKLVGLALKALEKSDAAGNYTVIVHGDHGSRLTRIDPGLSWRHHVGDADYIASHSTFFAVRVPDGVPKYVVGPLKVSGILENVVVGEFRKIPTLNPEIRPSVILADIHWRPSLEVPMPASFWSRDRPFLEEPGSPIPNPGVH
jgi:hypothetical protein